MKPGLRENIAGLRPISGLLTAVAVSRSAVMLYPFYAAYLAVERHELAVGAIGLIVGMFGIGALLADVFSGWLAARIPQQRIAVAGLAAVAGIVLVISLTTELWALAGLTAVWGFCYELVNPIATTLVATVMPESQRRFAFAAVRLAVNVGMGIGPVLAGLLFKVSPDLLPWGTAIGYVAAAVILARARVGARPDAAAGPAALAPEEDEGPARPGLRLWSFFVATMPIHFVYALPSTAISVYVIQTLARPAGWVSAIFAINAALVVTCEIALNHAMLEFSRRTNLLVGYACGVAGFALMAAGAGQTWWLLVATVLWTFGEMIIYPVMPDHISAISPNRLRTRNIGFYTANINLGVILAPMIFLPLLHAVTPFASWSIAGGLLFLGLVTTALISRSPRIWGTDKVRAAPVPAMWGAAAQTDRTTGAG